MSAAEAPSPTPSNARAAKSSDVSLSGRGVPDCRIPSMRGQHIHTNVASPASAIAGQRAPLKREKIAAPANKSAGQRLISFVRWIPPSLVRSSKTKASARTSRAGSTEHPLARRRQNFRGSPSIPGSFRVINRSLSSWRAARWAIRMSLATPSLSRSSSVSPCGNNSR